MKRKDCYVLCGLGIALLLVGCGNTSQTINPGTEMIVMESQSQEMEGAEAQSEENKDMAVTEETEKKNETETDTEQETENTEETTVNNQSAEKKPDTSSDTSNKPSEEQKPENQTTQETPQQKPEEQTPQTPTQETPSEQAPETPETPTTLNVKENLKFDEGYADYRIITDEYLEIRFYYFYEDGTYWTCYGGFYPESVLNTFENGFDESMRDNGLEVNGIVYYWSEGGCCWDGTYSVTDEELTFLVDEDGVYNMNGDGNLVNIDTGKMLVLDGSYKYY